MLTICIKEIILVPILFYFSFFCFFLFVSPSSLTPSLSSSSTSLLLAIWFQKKAPINEISTKFSPILTKINLGASSHPPFPIHSSSTPTLSDSLSTISPRQENMGLKITLCITLDQQLITFANLLSVQNRCDHVTHRI